MSSSAHVRELGRVAGWEREQLRDVHADDPFGVVAADLGGDLRAGVVAMRAVALVAEAGHQLDPGARRPAACPSPALRSARRTHAGDRGDHDVEGVSRRRRRARAGPSAVRSGRGTRRPTSASRACTSSGSASGSGDRTCMKWTSWPSMVVVNCGSAFKPGLLRAPVEAGAPVVDQLAHVLERYAVAQPASGSSSGQRTRARRACRSSRSVSGISTRKGRSSALVVVTGGAFFGWAGRGLRCLGARRWKAGAVNLVE